MHSIDSHYQAPSLSRRAVQITALVFLAISVIAALGSFVSLDILNPTSQILFSIGIVISPIAFIISRLFAISILSEIPMEQEAFYGHSFDKILICVDKSDLKNNPLPHLQKFVDQIGDKKSASISVEFIGQKGVDAGGLARDYLDDLAGGLAQQQNLFARIDESGLVVPRAGEENALVIFENLGRVIGFCCPPHIIGYHFDPSIFAVAFSLCAEELDQSFDELTTERKIALYDTLLKTQGVEMRDYHPLTLYAAKEWSEEQRQQLTKMLNEADLPIENLRESLLALINEYWENQLRGIHALAKGIKAHCIKWGIANDRSKNWKWNHCFFQSDAQEYSRSIQGSIDREQIIRQIVLENANQEVEKKADWLIDWISNGATDEEIKHLLKYITGSSGLKPDKQVTITGGGSPSPSPRTCSETLELPQYPSGHELYNDNSSENFINWMKFLINDPQNYTYT